MMTLLMMNQLRLHQPWRLDRCNPFIHSLPSFTPIESPFPHSNENIQGAQSAAPHTYIQLSSTEHGPLMHMHLVINCLKIRMPSTASKKATAMRPRLSLVYTGCAMVLLTPPLSESLSMPALDGAE